MDDKLNQIIAYLKKNECSYHNNINNDNLEIIYNLLINNEIIDYNDEIYYYCGLKFDIEKNYEEMKKYY